MIQVHGPMRTRQAGCARGYDAQEGSAAYTVLQQAGVKAICSWQSTRWNEGQSISREKGNYILQKVSVPSGYLGFPLFLPPAVEWPANFTLLWLCPHPGPNGRRTEGEKKHPMSSQLVGVTALLPREEELPVSQFWPLWALFTVLAATARRLRAGEGENGKKLKETLQTLVFVPNLPSTIYFSES